MKTTLRVLPFLIFTFTGACDDATEGPGDKKTDTDTETVTDTDTDTEDDVNPCNPDDLQDPDKPEIWEALGNLHCDHADTQVQAAADVTEGSRGLMEAKLRPILNPFSNHGMCPVNAHWHLGAEHKNTGTFDILGEEWMADHDPDYQDEWTDVEPGEEPEEPPEPGNFCHDYDDTDPMFTTPYSWQHCEHMKVGYTYEVHWPHSNLGMCGTKWQYQSHFMNGVLCKANQNYTTPEAAVDTVFETKSTRIGVQAMVFTVVNDPAFDYPDWNPLDGWNPELADNIAIYQGSTTGQIDGNNDCRGTGGMVTWQVDRGCHFISAKAFDGLCEVMLEQKVEMHKDIHPHNARETTDPSITTDMRMGPGVSDL